MQSGDEEKCTEQYQRDDDGIGMRGIEREPQSRRDGPIEGMDGVTSTSSYLGGKSKIPVSEVEESESETQQGEDEGRQELERLGIFLEKHTIQEDTVDVLSSLGWLWRMNHSYQCQAMHAWCNFVRGAMISCGVRIIVNIVDYFFWGRGNCPEQLPANGMLTPLRSWLGWHLEVRLVIVMMSDIKWTPTDSTTLILLFVIPDEILTQADQTVSSSCRPLIQYTHRFYVLKWSLSVLLSQGKLQRMSLSGCMFQGKIALPVHYCGGSAVYSLYSLGDVPSSSKLHSITNRLVKTICLLIEVKVCMS